MLALVSIRLVLGGVNFVTVWDYWWRADGAYRINVVHADVDGSSPVWETTNHTWNGVKNGQTWDIAIDDSARSS